MPAPQSLLVLRCVAVFTVGAECTDSMAGAARGPGCARRPLVFYGVL